MKDRTKFIETSIEKLNNRLNSFNPSEGSYENENKVKEIEQMINNIESQIEELEIEIDDDQNLSAQKPLNNKISKAKEELEISKNKFNRKKEAFKKAQNIELLKEGKLTGADKTKAEHDMIVDLNKETDLQGNIIESIGDNIKDANRNLVNINEELNKQGDQVNRINDHVQSANKEVKDTNKIMSKMERRAACMKVLGIITIIVMTLLNLALLTYKIIKFIQKKNEEKNKQKEPQKNGTKAFDNFFSSDDLDYIYEKEWEKKNSFAIMEVGQKNKKVKEFKKYYNKLKSDKTNAAIYWFSGASNETEAEKEGNTVLECIKYKLFEYPIYYFIDNPNQHESKKMADKFCSILKKNNYICGINSTKVDLRNFNGIKNKTMWIKDFSGDFAFQNCNKEKFDLGRNKKDDIHFNFKTDITFKDFPKEIKAKEKIV